MLKKRTLALLLAATFSGSLLAQAKTLDIPAQTLGSALTQLATQGGIQILFDAKDIQGFDIFNESRFFA